MLFIAKPYNSCPNTYTNLHFRKPANQSTPISNEIPNAFYTAQTLFSITNCVRGYLSKPET